MKYDYLIVGAGLFGSVFAYQKRQEGKNCLIIDKRKHLGGNLYCENVEGITVHKFGPHIFHTSNEKIWAFVNSLVEFNSFINSPLACFEGNVYNLPFNMNTFAKMWNIKSPEEAKSIINKQIEEANISEPKNLEEQALSLVGKDIFNTLIKGYTEKQWGRSCKDLPAFIIKRLPVRFTYNNNYFNDKYQGIPVGGYNNLIEKLLENVDIKLNTDYFSNRNYFDNIAEKILFTGKIDEFYNYQFGELEYRTVTWRSEIKDSNNFQGVAVMNFTEREVPYTRIIEHRHFETDSRVSMPDNKTVVSFEFSKEFEEGDEPMYPINDERNTKVYESYKNLAEQERNVIFGGRLAEYKYYDMDKIVENALETAKKQ
ncbi:MAG: UDP-galactopyranose mutase [Bacteroidales bacterium]|jgi:UDP-galactopyranose mutase|nr:UDP-galactopyranose mutase [Bacteroidales bacterium]